LATACDLVLATDTARFGYPEVKIGFVPAMVMAILRRNTRKTRLRPRHAGLRVRRADSKNFGLINEIFPENEFEEKSRTLRIRL
jgi:methylglutaconyl-CoA hydratase